AFRPHRLRGGQGQCAVHGVEDVAGHVAERAGAEVEPLAPLARVVVAFEERPLGRPAQPDVPVEVRRDRVGAVRPGGPGPPLLAAPAVDLLYLADRPLLDRGDDTPVDLAGVALDAHL